MTGTKGAHVRIVPGPQVDSGPNMTRGTRLYVGDVELQGVYHVVLSATVEGVWCAEVHLFPGAVPEVMTLANVHSYWARSRWVRLRNWWNGVERMPPRMPAPPPQDTPATTTEQQDDQYVGEPHHRVVKL